MDKAQIEMPKYKCHKEVWALKIREVKYFSDGSGGIIIPENDKYAEIIVGREYLYKHQPKSGGYYIVYKDGYISFSPAEPFEEGYTLI